MDEFSKLISLIKDGMSIPLTKKKCVQFDDFLIFNQHRRKQTVTIHCKSVPYWIDFDGDEPMLLEEIPRLFIWTLIKNIEAGNYTMPEK